MTNFTITYTPTKKDIIQRLFEAGHINFNEMWTLIQDNEGVQYIPMGVPNTTYPSYPWDGPQYTVSNDSDKGRFPQ